jgi:hypothetical protein
MKKLNLYTLILSIVFVFASCDDFLDTPPDNRVELDTPKNLGELLANAYPNRGGALLCAEFSSDNIDCNISSNWNYYQLVEEQVFNWQDVTEKSWESPQWIWDSSYEAIATANLVLEAIEEMGNTPNLNPYKAEALLCRAYNHFVLVNLFALHYKDSTLSQKDLGIVYIDHPEMTVNNKYERLSVAEVYSRINQDIETALPLINDQILVKKIAQFHFNKNAAYAFATRFNLYYRQYDKVIEYATEVLGNNPESMLRDWRSIGATPVFGDGDALPRAEPYLKDPASLLILSKNSLYARIFGPYTVGNKYAHNRPIANKETVYADSPWGNMNAILRLKGTTFSSEVAKVVLVYMDEYFPITNPTERIGTPYIMEVAFTTDEVLLCRAEAYVLKKQYDKAMTDLNTFMAAFSTAPARSIEQLNSFYNGINYYTPLIPTVKKILHPDFALEAGTQENMIHAVLQLRRVLTVHMGLRWYDVKRYGIEVTRRQVFGINTVTLMENKLTKDDPRRAIQLPQDVINAGMTPNPR